MEEQRQPPTETEPPTDAIAKERVIEQEQGLSPQRRGSPAAPSDRPEGDLPHPQDVNEISR